MSERHSGCATVDRGGQAMLLDNDDDDGDDDDNDDDVILGDCFKEEQLWYVWDIWKVDVDHQ